MDTRKTSRREEWLAFEAAEWVDRIQRADSSDEDAFLVYLQESPRNVQELLLAQAWDDELERLLDPERQIDVDALIQAAGNVVPLAPMPVSSAEVATSTSPSIDTLAAAPEEGPDNSENGNRAAQSHAPGVTKAASWWKAKRSLRTIAAILGFLTVVLLWSSSWMEKKLFDPSTVTTSIGEQRAVELADGSVIALNTQSAVRVSFSQTSRDVFLTQGQALFTVAKDPARPFRVYAGGAVVQAVGTKFDVRHSHDLVKVAVIEGRVQVTARPSSSSPSVTLTELADRAKLAAGQAITIQSDGTLTPTANVDPAEVSAWQQRRLVFRNNTLAEIADEFSRYNRAPQIVIEGDELRAQRIPVAVFDADDPESLIVFLASDGSLSFDKRGDELVIRRRASAEPSPN